MTELTLYLRKSTRDERRSVTRQQHDLTAAAADEGYTIGHIFIDPDLSASPFATRERPDYAALLEHIRSGECQMLGLWEGSRGSRELEEWASFLKLCAKRRVPIWIQANDRVYRPWRTNDWDELARLGVAAETESRQLSDRVLVGKRDAARNGTPAGRLQYGFTRVYDEKGKFVEQCAHPEQAPIVAEMVDRLHAGETLTAIAADLNARGLTMPGGSPWAGRFIRQMVLRPSYIGIRVDRGVELGPATWKPIVDVPRWRAVVALLTTPERRSTTRGTALTHWLTNAVRCGGCRRNRLSLHSGGRNARPRYICDRRSGCGSVFVAAGPLEAFIETLILDRLRQPDAFNVFRVSTDEVQVSRAEQEVDELRARLDAHYVEAAEGRLSARGLSVVEGQLLPLIERAEAKARRLAVPPALDDMPPAEAADKWGSFTPGRRRTYVREMADLVVTPATRRGPGLDTDRLGESRWVGDDRTWADIWSTTVDS